MLNSKQRAQLRALASKEDTIMQVGKNGMTDTLIATVSDALEARELIKLKALENCGMSAKEIADGLAAAVGAEVVATIGAKLILYRESATKKKIELC